MSTDFTQKIDLQKLISHIKNGDDAEVEREISLMRPVLVNYLRFSWRAPKSDAEDCAQDVLADFIHKVRNGEYGGDIHFGYLVTTCKNSYFRLYNEQKKETGVDELSYVPDSGSTPFEQIASNEMLAALKKCIQKLDEMHRNLINALLENPEIRAEELGTRLEISTQNVWVRRHRAVKQLSECVRKSL